MTKWHNRHLISATYFRKWKWQTERDQYATEVTVHILRRRALMYLQFWRQITSAGRSQQRAHRRRQGAALCFFVRRIFRAWRVYAVASACRSDPLVDAVDLLRAAQHWKHKLFRAWATSHIERNEHVRLCGEALVRHRIHETMHLALTEWRDISLTEGFRRRTERAWTLRKLANYATRRRSFKNNLRVARQRERTGRLRNALRHLYRFSECMGQLRYARNETRRLSHGHLLRFCLRQWKQSLISRSSSSSSPTRLSIHHHTSSRNHQQGAISQGNTGYPSSSTYNSHRHGLTYDYQEDQSIYTTSAAMNDHISGETTKGALVSAVQLRWQAIQSGKPWNLADPTDDDQDDEDDDDDDNTEVTRNHLHRRLASAIRLWYRFKVSHSKMRLTVQSVKELHGRHLTHYVFSQVTHSHSPHYLIQ